MTRRLGMTLRSFLVVGLFASVLAWAAVGQQLPSQSKDVHLGVASCAGSTCHGAVTPWKDANVQQNEYVTWTRQDKHAKAFEVLHNERSKRIAANLGLPNAHTAKICLDCHADSPAPEARGRTYQVSDGVGCEACHGGAVRWLGIHISGTAGHADNLKNGMYPTTDPVKRAELCLSCHFGNETKFVTHRIMGAGHPRMSFELDTFTAIQPAHFVVDADYRKRKPVLNGVQTWAIGQAIQLRGLLEALTSPTRSHDGIFPELVLFDCHACHHPMSNVRWQRRESAKLGPGIIRLNDANMIMLRIIATQVDEPSGQRLRDSTVKLHQASTQSPQQTADAAKEMLAIVAQLVDRFAKHTFERKDMEALLSGVTQEGMKGEFVDYATAEQATMALSAIINAMKQSGLVNDAQHKKMINTLNEAYDATAKDEAYRPEAFVAAMRKLNEAIPRS
ncbi:MAG: hypothetical protein EXQ91_00695 [Alphaproteobacteria bacterium]|nr:hypothetical protein [Alphaproteobacteria bacterium]